MELSVSEVTVASPSTTASERACRFKEYREKKARVAMYLNSGLYVEGLTHDQKRIIRRQAKNYVYDKACDELYYTGIKNKKTRVILHEDEALEIMKRCHSPQTGGHRGINATMAKISMDYVWNGMKHDTVEFIKSCDQCQGLHKITCKPHPLPENEIQQAEATEPMELVGMSFTGPLPTTPEDYKYVLSFVDYYTRFVEFFPLRNKETRSLASCVRTFVWRWGAPKRLLSDQGPEVVTKINEDLCELLEVRRSVISTNHPRKKGLESSVIRTLTTRLGKLVNEHQDNWADYLDGVAFSMRSQKHSTTKHIPFFQMFGRHPRTVLEMDPVESVGDDQTPYPKCDKVGTEILDNNVVKSENEMGITGSKVPGPRRNKLKMKTDLINQGKPAGKHHKQILCL